ncbi:6505_t:CDS:2 [Funneliformis geosporum]|uniref:18349_t:CDS:1 n=1 Tax=Funneliformis geosporum TaxID=1117311 RepID=A0A9W4WZ04_9GLOM|nr:18349_t:CDS:2 [Funneliformis geosporum]CAI2186019.1 6505_t:CDS:2 [Funneliformis geosporum]
MPNVLKRPGGTLHKEQDQKTTKIKAATDNDIYFAVIPSPESIDQTARFFSVDLISLPGNRVRQRRMKKSHSYRENIKEQTDLKKIKLKTAH